MNRPVSGVSRHPATAGISGSARNLRLGALVLVFVAINQIDDALVGATIGEELLYWCVRLCVLSSGLWLADWLVARMPANMWAHPAWLRPVVLVSVLGLLPYSIAEIVVEPYLPLRPEYVDDDLWAYSPLLAWLGEYASIATVLIPVHLLLWLILERRGVDPNPTTAQSKQVELPAFLDATSVRSLDDIVALEAEEHYVRVHTLSRSELVHCRFRDAVDAMPIELGIRVHRSWWVATAAVASASRGARRWQLTLSSSVTVPVSDSYVAAARSQGLLKNKRRV